MAVTAARPSVHPEHNYTRWVWLTLGLTPILFATGIAVSFAASGAGPGAGGAVVGVLALAAPTAALILSVGAVRARESSARALMTTAVLVYAGCVLLLPVAVISVNAWLIALAVSVVVLALAGWRLAR